MPPRRKRKEKPKLPDTAIDYAALDRRVRLQGIEVDPYLTESAARPAVRVTAEPLDRYHRRDLIGPRQYYAGNKLREDYREALGPSGGRWFAEPGGGVTDAAPQAGQIAASRRLAAAQRAVGRHPWHWLSGVILDGEPVETIAGQLRIDRKQGMGKLTMALDMLADHYGIR